LIDSFNQQIELFQKQKEDAIKIAELEEFRDALVFGDPCPLCGSKEHPYLEDKPEIQKNEIDQKVNKAKKALEEQKEERDLLIKELTQCVTSKELILKRISELSVEMSNADKEVEKVIATFTGQSSISKEKISQSIKVLSDYNDKTKEALEAVVENKTNKELTAQYRELEEQLDSYKVLKKNRDSKFDGSDVSVITNELQDTFEISKSKITELTAVIEKESNSLKSNSELATSIANELESKIKELGFSDIKDISNNVLEEDIYDDLTEKLKRLNREETSIEPV